MLAAEVGSSARSSRVLPGIKIEIGPPSTLPTCALSSTRSPSSTSSSSIHQLCPDQLTTSQHVRAQVFCRGGSRRPGRARHVCPRAVQERRGHPPAQLLAVRRRGRTERLPFHHRGAYSCLLVHIRFMGPYFDFHDMMLVLRQ